jgi:hypothetical protein
MVNNITNDNKQTTPQATLKLPNKEMTTSEYNGHFWFGTDI